MAASIQVADDLGGDLIGDFYASAEYRKAIAAEGASTIALCGAVLPKLETQYRSLADQLPKGNH